MQNNFLCRIHILKVLLNTLDKWLVDLPSRLLPVLLYLEFVGDLIPLYSLIHPQMHFEYCLLTDNLRAVLHLTILHVYVLLQPVIVLIPIGKGILLITLNLSFGESLFQHRITSLVISNQRAKGYKGDEVFQS